MTGLLALVVRSHRKFRKPQARMVWVVRRTDGKFWAGEYRWQGQTFTDHIPFIYLYGTRSACMAGAERCGFANVEAVEVELSRFAKRPMKRRGHHTRRR